MNDSYTSFASAKRSPQSEILRQYEILKSNADLVVFLNGVASMVTILNLNRQIVFVNNLTLLTLGLTDIHQVLGKRIGEAFGCQHAFTVNGCGTSPHCSACGAVRSMLDCVSSTEAIEECSLTNDESMATFDLRVHSTFTRLYGEELIICSLFDVSDEKRRNVLEHIFFHDILNTINGISGMAQVLQKVPPEKQSVYLSHLTRLLKSLVDEVNSHRILTMAERNEYKTAEHHLRSLDFITEEIEIYRQVAATDSKIIKITEDSENHEFVTDRILLSRVLGNMLKNALEAESNGATIEIGVRKGDDRYLHFYVYNDSVIPPKNQLQIFNRSFSTKGEGRGLGTYSMKLLTEKYLNGMIDFVSESGKGTFFTVKLPVLESDNAPAPESK